MWLLKCHAVASLLLCKCNNFKRFFCLCYVYDFFLPPQHTHTHTYTISLFSLSLLSGCCSILCKKAAISTLVCSYTAKRDRATLRLTKVCSSSPFSLINLLSSSLLMLLLFSLSKVCPRGAPSFYPNTAPFEKLYILGPFCSFLICSTFYYNVFVFCRKDSLVLLLYNLPFWEWLLVFLLCRSFTPE